MKSLALLFLVAAPLPAQILEGNVVNSVTGAPVAGVHISTTGTDPAYAVSDAAGHFRLTAPGPQQTWVLAMHPGFFFDRSGPFQPGQPPSSDLRVALTPQAVITGKLEDEDGFPVSGANVQARYYQIVEGRRKLQSASVFAQTNDLGEFRLAGLFAARYYLCISRGALDNWDPRYTGECPDPKSAKAIDVKTGEEVNVPLIRWTRRQGVTVSGRVALPSALPAGRMRAVELRASEQYLFPLLLDAWLQSDGGFAMRHVPPGSYLLRFNSGQGRPPKPGDFLAEQQIQVADSDLQNITLAPHEVRAVNLAGRVVAEDGCLPGPLTISLLPRPGTTIAVTSGEGGAFEFKGVLPGHYEIMVAGAPRAATPTSALLGEKEVLQSGFDLDGTPAGPLRITVSARVTWVTGQVLDAAGHALPNAAVLLLGTEGRLLLGTDYRGDFRSNLVLPGDYQVYAVADSTQFDLLDDPGYLRAHQADLPPVHVFAERNPPLTIRLPGAK
jgi:hypothetical protein